MRHKQVIVNGFQLTPQQIAVIEVALTNLGGDIYEGVLYNEAIDVDKHPTAGTYPALIKEVQRILE